ncbi:unnamed protein product [Urochloa humidicola]
MAVQLEVQNQNCELDRKQRKDQANGLVLVLGRITDDLGMIADKQSPRCMFGIGNNYPEKKMTFVSECVDWYSAYWHSILFGTVLEFMSETCTLGLSYIEMRFIAFE